MQVICVIVSYEPKHEENIMIESIVTNPILQPEVNDHENTYSRFLCNTPKKQYLFDLITTPDSISSALIVAQETGSSPIIVFESRISNAVSTGVIQPLDSHEKQFVGTVICTVMETNGWRKTQRKQRFSTGIFKSAEIYELAA